MKVELDKRDITHLLRGVEPSYVLKDDEIG